MLIGTGLFPFRPLCSIYFLLLLLWFIDNINFCKFYTWCFFLFCVLGVSMIFSMSLTLFLAIKHFELSYCKYSSNFSFSLLYIFAVTLFSGGDLFFKNCISSAISSQVGCLVAHSHHLSLQAFTYLSIPLSNYFNYAFSPVSSWSSMFSDACWSPLQ